MAEVEMTLRDAAERALAAYQHRFGSVAPPLGNYIGPIDEEMQALRAALAGACNYPDCFCDGISSCQKRYSGSPD